MSIGGNIAEFVLKIKDLNMSSGFRAAGATAQSAFRSAERSVNQFAGRVRQNLGAVNGLNNSLNNLRHTRNISIDTRQVRSASGEVQRLNNLVRDTSGRLRDMNGRFVASGSGAFGGGGGRMGGGGLLGMLGGVRGLVAGMALGGVVAAGGAVVSNTVNAGLNAGAQKTSFQVMAGDKDGNTLYRDITKFANDSIFGKELYGNAQTMLAFGATAKEVMPDLKMLGDISMGNKEQLKSLTLAYSQVRAAGKLTGQDLLQMINAGFNPLQVISEKTGKTIGTLKEQMEKGNISFALVKKAFEGATSAGGRFYNMTSKIADTPFGKWEAAKGQMDGLMLQAGAVLAPVVGQLIDGVAVPMMDKLAENITPFTTEMIAYGREFVPVLKSLSATTGTFLKNTGAFLASTEIKDLTKSTLTLASELAKTVIPVVSELTKVAKDVSPAVTAVTDTLGGMFRALRYESMRNDYYRKEQAQAIRDEYIRRGYIKPDPAPMAGNAVTNLAKVAPAFAKMFSPSVGPMINPYNWTQTNLSQIALTPKGFWQMRGAGMAAGLANVGQPGSTNTNPGTGLGGSNDFGELGEKVTKGGPQQVIFKMEALSKNTFNVTEAIEATEKLEETVEASVVRVFNSLGLIR